ncbi:hypothetical protein DXA46_00195 [Bacteroides sp. OF02-3LB]|nr:hypothetical protein DXA46_00195 [Bacteroides sp. OF02-3LB]
MLVIKKNNPFFRSMFSCVLLPEFRLQKQRKFGRKVIVFLIFGRIYVFSSKIFGKKNVIQE